jgi:hypothetical protein
MKKVLQSNDYDVPTNDLYGRLFYYIVDKMKDFVELIKTKKVFIHIYDKDAIDLLEELHQKNIKFDRIECF